MAPRMFREASWRRRDGLPDDTVTACLQTHEGYLWIGTDKGLARFDGLAFRVFDTWNTPDLHSDRISALSEDGEGTLWIGTRGGGVTRYRQGEFTHAGLSIQFVSALQAGRNGTVWIGTEGGGLFVLTPGSGTANPVSTDLPDLSVQVVVQGRDGTLWLGTRDAGLVALHAGALTRVPLDEQAPPTSVNAIHEDPAGRLWVGTSAGLFRSHKSGFSRFRAGADPPDEHILVVTGDGRGNLWIGTKNGAVTFQPGSGNVGLRPAEAGGGEVSVCVADRDGNVWTGGPGSGLRKLSPMTVGRLTARVGLNNEMVNCIHEGRQGQLWLGTQEGLTRLEHGEQQVYGEEDGLACPVVTSLLDDSALGLLIGTPRGLYRLEKGVVERLLASDGWPEAGVWALLRDRAGTLWVGTSQGLFQRGPEGHTRHTADSGLPANDVRALVEGPDDRLWIGTTHGVAARSAGMFIAQPAPAGSLTRISLTLHVDPDGTLWCGTLGGGLVRYGSKKAFVYTARHGLPDNTIYQVLDDNLGSLWLTSNSGVFRVAREALDRVAEGRSDRLTLAVYGRHDGLPSEACGGFGQPAGCLARDGLLWIPTTRGVAIIEPAQMVLHASPPPVVIDRFVVDNRSMDVRVPAEIGPGAEQFQFHFVGLDFAVPEQIRYRYRLLGFDPDWIEADTRRTAYYTRLPHGSYRFQVTACKSDGVWNETPATMEVMIVPNFWQTWWFLTAATTVLLLAMAGTVRYVSTRRLRRSLAELERQRALENERTRIAHDLHDGIGSGLTRIGKVAEMAEHRAGAGGELPDLMHTIRETTRTLVQSMDEIVWTINPRNDTLENMANYLVHYTEEFLRVTGITYQLDVPVTLPDAALSADVRHSLFMTAKEALNNAVKHAKPSRIRLALELTDGRLIITVEDDGVGFSPQSDRGTGSGLGSMRHRLESVGGRLELQTAADGGTTVCMSLAFPPGGADPRATAGKRNPKRKTRDHGKQRD